MRVLLIIPPDDIADKYLSKFESNFDTVVPLGMAQLASVLEANNHVAKILDIRIDRDKLKKTLQDFKPEIIGLSGYFHSLKKMFRIANNIKKIADIPIFLGGSYPSLYPYKILDNMTPLNFLDKEESIDFLIKGEGEIVIPELLNALSKKNIKNIKGLCYRENKKTFCSEHAPLVRNLDKLPFPAFHLLKRYTPLPKHYKRLPVIPMTTSRGCYWGRCTFCTQPNIDKYYRRQNPERAIQEIDFAIKKHKIKEIRFWDDSFIHDKEWILDFCKRMKHLDVIWSCHARPDSVDEQIIKAMAEAGCWQIFYGIEAANPKILKRINKGITLEQARKAVMMTKKAGIETRVAFMFGLPGESPKKAKAKTRFAKKLDADITQISISTPYPHTSMCAEINPDRLDKDLNHYTEYKIVYLPEGYANKKMLMRKYKEAYRKIYLDPRFMWKKILGIRKWEDIRRYFSGFQTFLGLAYSRKR